MDRCRLVCEPGCATANSRGVLKPLKRAISWLSLAEPLGNPRKVQTELDRVLRNKFVMEIYKFESRLVAEGALSPQRIMSGLSAAEWTDVWRMFRPGRVQISHGYSELLFHPDFRLQPRRYPMKREHALDTCAPKLAGLVARQVHVRVETRGI